MSEDQTFLLPVVIDGTPEAHARVPDKFRDVQWTHLPAGEASAAFVERMRRLIAGGTVPPPHWQTPLSPQAPVTPPQNAHAAAPSDARRYLPRVALVLSLGLVLVATAFLWRGRSTAPPRPASAPAAPAPPPAFAPPPHSVAVLPFVNMSGDPKQDYFSDGLSEELLNSLVTVRELQVAARTSSFFFKGKDVDLSLHLCVRNPALPVKDNRQAYVVVVQGRSRAGLARGIELSQRCV